MDAFLNNGFYLSILWCLVDLTDALKSPNDLPSMNRIFTVLTLGILSSLSALMLPASADLLPTRGLALYSDYRKEILRLGWKPEPSISSIYGWPEVICGNRLCSARFISENGKQTLVLSIWQDARPGRTDYYVAPSFDLEDAP